MLRITLHSRAVSAQQNWQQTQLMAPKPAEMSRKSQIGVNFPHKPVDDCFAAVNLPSTGRVLRSAVMSKNRQGIAELRNKERSF